MLKLALKGSSLLAATVAACWYLYSLNPVAAGNPNDYMAAIIDKHHRLDSLPSPKLVFVGASNLAFGLNCKMIEDSLRIPVVNMGLHGGLGLSFILNEGREDIHAGDVVVLSIEYYVGLAEDPQLIKKTIELYPPAARYTRAGLLLSHVNASMQPGQLVAYIERIQSTVLHGVLIRSVASPQSGYRRGLFSEYGDVVGELNMPKPPELRDSKLGKNDYDQGIRLLNQYADYIRSHGASVYFTYPNYPASIFEKNKKAIDYLRNQYAKSLNIPIIDAPEDFVLPDSLFIDTVYHLKKEGREERTKRLIAALKSKVFSRTAAALR